ncbi:MAG TPA: hypothetical protein VHM25_02110 [Polyangiaceae bacterium]|nr:hypothetical protein [Polyangiaceae bacterium]
MKRTTRHILPVLVCSASAALLFVGCSSDPTEQPSSPGKAGSGNHNQAGATGTAGAAAVGGSSSTAGQSSGTGGSAGSSIAGNTSSTGGSSAGGSVGTAGASSGTGGKGASGGSTSSGGAGGKGSGGGASGGGASGGGSGGGGSTTSGMSAGCGKAPTIASNMYNNGKPISMMVGSMQRRYVLSVPTNYVNTKAYKLVIAYHQRDGNDLQMYANQYYHLQPLSKDSTIFVAPNGQLNNAPCTGMSDKGESSCGWPNPNDTDMNFADALVKAVEESFCIDTNRIFATGWSYGGSMSYATACARPLGATNGFIRAIAVYSGSQLSGQCTPSKPVGYYASHGTGDQVLCYDGNSSGCQVGNGMQLAQNFAKANGCTWATPQKVTSGNHVCTSIMGCTSGYPTEFCSFSGDHTPDPRDPGQSNSWEYQKAWDFLNQF